MGHTLDKWMCIPLLAVLKLVKEIFERQQPNEWNHDKMGKVVIAITPSLSGLIVDNFQTWDTNRKYQWVVCLKQATIELRRTKRSETGSKMVNGPIYSVIYFVLIPPGDFIIHCPMWGCIEMSVLDKNWKMQWEINQPEMSVDDTKWIAIIHHQN